MTAIDSPEAVFERDWRRYGSVVGGRLGRRWRGIPPADREDLAADVGILYLRELRTRQRPDHPKAWLRQVCDNRAKNWLRDRAANPGRSATLAEPDAPVLREHPDERPGPAVEAEARIGAEQVKALLDRVDPEDAALAHRLYIQERNAKDVADELGLGVRTVQRRGPAVLDAAAQWMREIEHPEFLARLEQVLARVKAGSASNAQVKAIRRLAANGDPDCARALRHLDEGLQGVALAPVIELGARATTGEGVGERLVATAHKAREAVLGADSSGGFAGRLGAGDGRGAGATVAELGARIGEVGAAKIVAVCTVAGATATACVAGVAGVGPLADLREARADRAAEHREVSDSEPAIGAAQAPGELMNEIEAAVETPSAGASDQESSVDENAAAASEPVAPESPTPAEEQFDPLATQPPVSTSTGGGSSGQSAPSQEFGGP